MKPLAGLPPRARETAAAQRGELEATWELLATFTARQDKVSSKAGAPQHCSGTVAGERPPLNTGQYNWCRPYWGRREYFADQQGWPSIGARDAALLLLYL